MNPIYAALSAAVALASTVDTSLRGKLVSALTRMAGASPLDFRALSMDAMCILAQAATEGLNNYLNPPRVAYSPAPPRRPPSPSWIGIWSLVQHQLQTATGEVCFAPSWEGIDLTPLRDANDAVTSIVNLGQSWEG